MSPVRGEKTKSKARYPNANNQAIAAGKDDSDTVATPAMTKAEQTEATVPEAYIAAALPFDTFAIEAFSVESVRMGTSRARPANLGGRTRARVVRPKRMVLKRIPTILPAM
jgi:hypothetical protein